MSTTDAPYHLTLKSLETEPIERIEEGDDLVRFTSIRLLAPGVWSDAGSQTATYYPPEGIANLEPEWDESEHDGPPINIMHDLDMETFEAHEASIAGYVDPDTLDTDDEGNLYADLVFDTSNGAGMYAAENLTSTLGKEGTVGFGGPSVEIPAEGLQQTHDETRDMPRVDGGLLTGTGMVFNPASKNVNFAREAARRPVAMSASGESEANPKVLTRETSGMRTKLLEGVATKLLEADPDELRETLGAYGLEVGDMDDEEVTDMAEQLHADLMEDVEAESDDYDGKEKSGEGEGEEEDDEDDDTEMDGGDDVEALRETVTNLSSRLEDLEDAVSQAMTADDVDAELAEAAGNKLADAETVKTLKEDKADLEARVEELESQPAESKTLTDADDTDIDWSTAEDGVQYDPATGSMSR